MDFNTFRTWFDIQFAVLLEQKIKNFTQESASVQVADIAQYTKQIAAKGKRFRPFLAYNALLPEKPEDHVLLFVALELLHVFALIHDDIMDQAVTRHGVLCAHQVFSTTHNNKQVGEGVAILLGDLVYQWSYECMFAYTQLFPTHASRLLTTYGELIREVIHGQMLDVIAPAQAPLPIELITQKMYLKTARYSFIQPLRMGFIAQGDAKALPAQEKFAEHFGKSLGIMFQLQDDIFDITEGHEKASFSDIETNQQTVFTWYMQHRAEAGDSTLFSQFLGKKLTIVDRHTVTQLLETSGAKAFVEREIERYHQEALAVAIDMKDRIWKEIVALVAHREK